MLKTLSAELATEKDEKVFDENLKHAVENIPFNYPEISSVRFDDKSGETLFISETTPSTPKDTVVSFYSEELNGTFTATLKREISDFDFTKNIFVPFFIGIIVILASAEFISRRKNKYPQIILNGLKYLADGHYGVKVNPEDFENPKMGDIFNDLSEKLKSVNEYNKEMLSIGNKKFDAVLRGISNGIAVCDVNDKFLLLNPAAKKMLNTSLTVSSSVLNYTNDRKEKCFEKYIEEFKDTPLDELVKSPKTFSVFVNKAYLKCVLSPMFYENGEYAGYIMVMTDITKETEINKMKNAFISNVSHELRTPVTVLRTYLDTLATVDLDRDTEKEFINTANREVIRLHTMVNDILDTSRLESSEHKSEKELLNIVETVKDSIESIEILAKEKNVVLEFQSEGPEINLYFCKTEIERVMSNLLSNAMKYSPSPGQIEIRIKKEDEYVDVSVRDYGPGIEEKNIDKIFNRFYRVENSVHSVKGTGIGLYLVKLTVEKYHGGKVYVKSKPGRGSLFGFKLPLNENVTMN